MSEKAVQKKPSFNPVQFAREVKQEIKRVTWPTRRETVISTVMVLILILIAALFFTVVDTIIGTIVQWILGLGQAPQV